MKKFKFRLQKVLDYRTKMEDQAYERLQAAVRKRVQHENAIRAKKLEWQSAAQTGGEPLDEKLRKEEYLTALQMQIDEMEDALPLYQQEEERVRKAYLEARRARESLSKLQEQALSDHKKEAEAENQKMLDEWAGRKKIDE